MVVLLVKAVLTSGWRDACAAGLGGEVEDLADLRAGLLEGVWELVGHLADEDVAGEGGSVERESVAN